MFNLLAEVLVHTTDVKAAKKLLQDVLTPNELESILTRIQIMTLLRKGLTQRDVAKRVGVSIAKVIHGARFLKEHPDAFSQFDR